NMKAKVAEPADDCAGSRCLAGVHAGAGERYDRNAEGVEDDVCVQLARPDARRYADAFAEIREMQDGAEHLAIERGANVGVRGVADADNATDVQDLHNVADLQAVRQVSGVTEQRLAMPECANHDVALLD